MTEVEPELLELARLYGVMTSYEERPGGPERHATREALRSVLSALGAPIDEASDLREAVRARRAERWETLTEPVTVAWSQNGEAAEATVPVRLTRGDGVETLELRLVLADGETREWRTTADALESAQEQDVDGRARSVARLRVPGELPHGYHWLDVRAGHREGRTMLVAAPTTTWDPFVEESRRRAADPRDLGLFLPLYALRTARSWGTADLTDLRSLLEWGGRHGARFVGTLPLLATFTGGGHAPLDPGPYAPVSRLFWNELYLDAERAPGLDLAPEAQALLASRSFRDEARRLRDTPRVQYQEAMALKRRVLEAIARALSPAEEPLLGELSEFAGARAEVMEYARFRAVMERLGAPWMEWPTALREGAIPRDPRDEEAFRYHLFVQWAMESQLAELSDSAQALPQLYFDLPLGSHADGFDVWRFRKDFAPGLAAGAPPDPFQPEGQDWGFPPLHPERTREDGHAYTRRSLAHLMRACGMLRLDHVMHLQRLYCVPLGHAPLDGAYLRYPAEELYAILCVESNRWRCEVSGEDLGTVPNEVRDAMTHHRLRRMHVLPFELRPGQKRTVFPEPHPLTVTSLGTHDMPPFAAFWSGSDIDQKLAQGIVTESQAKSEHAERARWRDALQIVLERRGRPSAEPAEGAPEVLTSALRLLAASPARHLLINVEDLWGETESQNSPGTVGEHNWTLKARHPLEDWAERPGVEDLLATLVEDRRRKPRKPARKRKAT